MNILLLDQYSDAGGAQQVLLELLPAIRKRAWRPLVGLPGNGPLFDLVRRMEIETVRIECGPYRSTRKSVADLGRFLAGTPRLAAQIRTLARQMQAELVYLNGPRLVPAAALASLRCPVMFHSHSYLGPGMTRAVTGLALRRLDARVVAACEFVASQWRPFLGARLVSVIFNGVAGPVWTPSPRPDGPPCIGCIGRIGREKGQREFVAAAVRIRESLPECRFVICGEALFGDAEAERYAREVRAAASGLPMEFRGWVPDVYGALADLDLLLVPSVGPEATTRVILEAFAAGVPVIAFPSGGISEVVANGVTGLLAHSVEEMAQQAVALLARGSHGRIAMARRARSEWERRFTREIYQGQILQAMETCAGCRRLTPASGSGATSATRSSP